MGTEWYCPKCGPDIAVVHWGGAYGGVRCAECKSHGQSQPPAFVTAMQERIAELEKVAVRLYNLGYHAGHEHTVEGYYTHIYQCDMDEYHDDVVAEILKEQE